MTYSVVYILAFKNSIPLKLMTNLNVTAQLEKDIIKSHTIQSTGD